jgi:Sigma-70 region 2
MHDQDWLAERFEANRAHLRGVAFRMLGSLTEADDAVQEAWIRLSRTDTSDVELRRVDLCSSSTEGHLRVDRLHRRRDRRDEITAARRPSGRAGPQ